MDEIFMKRCFYLARKALGNTYPNPLVGAVLVHDKQIIGEGYHHKAGEPHAEVMAVNSVKQDKLLKESTLYVNLEPCSHFGKTPPCSDLIIRKEIPRVVIANKDPFPEVSGRGIKKLLAAGIDVRTGVLEDLGNDLNKRFFCYHSKGRPYIILKWAESRDGYIDVHRKPDAPIGPHWITDERARMLVHKWRSEEASILVGTNTVVKDNPSLNVRDWKGNNPIRLVIDREMRLNKDSKVFDGETRTILFTEKPEKHQDKKNLEVINYNGDSIQAIMKHLSKEGIQSVFVEGGARLLNAFIEKGLWDEARVFRGGMNFRDGIKAPDLSNRWEKEQIMGNARLLFFRNR